ncbi:MAG: hypothetical protein WCB92_32610 [Mycobacterium sp.]
MRRGGFSLQQAAPAYLAISALVSGWSEFTPSSVRDEESYHDLAAALAAGSKIAPRERLRFALRALLTGLHSCAVVGGDCRSHGVLS